MVKQSQHFCKSCQKKTLHQTEKYGLIAFIFTFGLSAIANILKGAGFPRCQECGTRRGFGRKHVVAGVLALVVIAAIAASSHGSSKAAPVSATTKVASSIPHMSLTCRIGQQAPIGYPTVTRLKGVNKYVTGVRFVFQGGGFSAWTANSKWFNEGDVKDFTTKHVFFVNTWVNKKPTGVTAQVEVWPKNAPKPQRVNVGDVVCY